MLQPTVTLRKTVKRVLEAGLRVRGYELKEIDSPPRGYRACLEYAKARGLNPRTVLDVGVGNGTPWLYEAFPAAKLVLFEPLAVFNEDLETLAHRYRADVHRVALGAFSGTAALNQNTTHPTSSSLLQMDPTFAAYASKVQGNHRFTQTQVSIETLDRLNRYEGPYVLKLDVEGSEMEVLKGARATLERTDFLITEISVMRRQIGEPVFAEMIEFLDRAGLELFDIPYLAQTNGNGQLIYLDAAFVQRNSPLWPR
jgi:FkbM family methyltransferase